MSFGELTRTIAEVKFGLPATMLAVIKFQSYRTVSEVLYVFLSCSALL
jgi:hypothetical protein